MSLSAASHSLLSAAFAADARLAAKRLNNNNANTNTRNDGWAGV
ncbi:hypothetical protein [Frateuria defendens]|nr:hypothetical protein [Frateuria defendens]